MRQIIILLLISATISLSQNNPVIGENYVIKYDVSEKNIFEKNSELTLVYTFDYWGTMPSRDDNPEELFQNVLKPIPNRVHIKLMAKEGNIYTYKILIPDTVALLSYYITDGIKNDYNNNATYTKLVYGKNGKPVEGAKFRKIEFMVMGKESIDNQIKLLQEELKDYPEYHIDRFVLWNKIFEKQTHFDDLLTEKTNAINYFEKLIDKNKEEWELHKSYFKVLGAYQNKLYKFLMPEFTEIRESMLNVAEMVPESERSMRMQSVVESVKRQEESKELKANIVGKPAFDFDYTTIDGKNGKLSDFRGKIVLLDFWGTWCGPCVGEIPNLVKAYKKYNERGFEIISISSDGFNDRLSKEDFIKFTVENNMVWTQILDSKDKRLHNIYKISHWPTLYLIGKDGKVIKNEEVLRGEALMMTLEELLK